MSWPLDQPIRLTFPIFSDAARTIPADTNGTVVLDVVKPDGTTASFTLAASQVVHGATGVYYYDYTPPLAGHYPFHWHSTGSVTTAVDGSFDVAPKYDAGLLDLTTAKKHLGIESTTDDDELGRFIARATPIVETLAGPVIQRTITDEQHTVSGNRIALLQRPVVSVTTITEYVGKTAYPVTVAATPNATGTYGATLDTGKGVLTRWASGSPQTWAQTVWVTYVAGRASVPDNVEQATLELIRHLWETQRGNSTGRPTPGFDVETSYVSGYAVPNRVVEMLGGDARVDGFA